MSRVSWIGLFTRCRAEQALAEGGAQLEELELAFNDLTEGGATPLAAALRRPGAEPSQGLGARLRRLVLRDNELADGGALTLAPGLAALPALAELDLCQNQARSSRFITCLTLTLPQNYSVLAAPWVLEGCARRTSGISCSPCHAVAPATLAGAAFRLLVKETLARSELCNARRAV